MEASGLLHASAAFPVIRSLQWTRDRTVVGLNAARECNLCPHRESNFTAQFSSVWPSHYADRAASPTRLNRICCFMNLVDDRTVPFFHKWTFISSVSKK
jgi:hypothetical protein